MRSSDDIPRPRPHPHTEAYRAGPRGPVAPGPARRRTTRPGDGIPVFVPHDRSSPPRSGAVSVPTRTNRKSDGKDLSRPGARIGRYVIARPLGRGGMGVVYGAVDPTLGRRVAIKLVRLGDHGQPFRSTARLQREALALARLSHPNIVGIYDFGMTAGGTFVAMEFIPGCSLKAWLETPRSVADIVEVFVQAGRGLVAAHEAGIVHRDFKPSNVMVTPEGTVKVLDFGLARGTPSEDPWLEGTADDSLLSRKLTRADVILGTTGYMSPEQLLGRQVGPYSDQFSFCVALFEAIYGVRPFPGRNPIELARSYADGLRNTPKTPRKVPSRLHALIERGLSMEPAERYPSMQALLNDLARGPRIRWRTVAGFLVVLSTACLSAAATMWFTQAPDQRAACVQPPTAPAIAPPAAPHLDAHGR